MRVVITGGNGFVGQHVARELTAAWPDVAITVWNVPEVDITQPATYRAEFKALQPEWLIHLAALAAVGPSAGAWKRYMSVNAEGTRQLLSTMVEESPATRALVVSSAELYGLTSLAQAGKAVSELPLADCRPANPYGESKLAMEEIIEDQFLERVIRVRPFPHFGPGQQKGFVAADFASQIAAIEQGEGSPLLRVGNLTAHRDFTDVRDVARAYRLLLEQGRVGEVYNVGSGTAHAIQDIMDQLLALASVPITVEPDPARLRPSDVPILVSDSQKLRALTKWEPAISFEQSLQDILNDWRQRV